MKTRLWTDSNQPKCVKQDLLQLRCRFYNQRNLHVAYKVTFPIRWIIKGFVEKPICSLRSKRPIFLWRKWLFMKFWDLLQNVYNSMCETWWKSVNYRGGIKSKFLFIWNSLKSLAYFGMCLTKFEGAIQYGCSPKIFI